VPCRLPSSILLLSRLVSDRIPLKLSTIDAASLGCAGVGFSYTCCSLHLDSNVLGMLWSAEHPKHFQTIYEMIGED
jgi:hypothetical protein